MSDGPSRANAGLIGPLSANDVSADLRAILDQMKPGDITQPIRTSTGYQILKLEARAETKTMPFDEAREQISNRVFTDKRQIEYDKYLEKLRAQAIIEWKNADIQKAYERGLEETKTGMRPPAAQ
jgi:parvulin-like peptidyl-prolyl isomerase